MENRYNEKKVGEFIVEAMRKKPVSELANYREIIPCWCKAFYFEEDVSQEFVEYEEGDLEAIGAQKSGQKERRISFDRLKTFDNVEKQKEAIIETLNQTHLLHRGFVSLCIGGSCA